MANLIPIFPETTPEIFERSPCMDCVSDTDIKKVIVLALAVQSGLTISQVMDQSKCMTCLSKSQLLRTAATALAEAYLSSYSAAQAQAAIKCLCAAQPSQLDAAIVYGIQQVLGAET